MPAGAHVAAHTPHVTVAEAEEDDGGGETEGVGGAVPETCGRADAPGARRLPQVLPGTLVIHVQPSVQLTYRKTA